MTKGGRPEGLDIPFRPLPHRPRIFVSANTSWNIVNFRAGLIRGLVGAGYDVSVAAPADDCSERLGRLGCRYIRLPMDNKGTSPANDLALLVRYYGTLRRERPHLFLGFTIKPNLYGSLAAHAVGVPVINNISGLGTAFIRQTWITWVAKRLYRTALARSRVVFFQNSDDAKLFREHGLVREAQTSLLPGSGIDLDAFRPMEGHAADNAFRFLLVARLLRDKGICEYVEAARIVRRQIPGARFQLLGFLDVENRTAIDRGTVNGWVDEGLIEYLGASDDVRPFIGSADCVVLPSYREGTPRTLLEAAAMGKPVIATDVPGCREAVDPGINGFLCNPFDAADLADRMLQLLQMPAAQRDAMGKASRAKAERQFDERIVVARYLDVIRRVIAA